MIGIAQRLRRPKPAEMPMPAWLLYFVVGDITLPMPGALTADGGSPGPCGWVKDKYGFSLQLQPDAIMDLYKSGYAAGIGRMMDTMMTMQKLNAAKMVAAFKGEAA